MRHPVQALIYLVSSVDNDWKYLLLHRLASRGDFWQGVTGGIEEGEEIHEAARRELIEETGIIPFEIKQIDYAYSFPVADGWRHLYAEGVKEVTEYVFVAHVDGQQEPKIDTCEHDKWEWCNFSQALALLIWPGNIDALKRCDNFLRGHSSLE
jgi:dihydroneopterin triphosphate diphosphatase